MDVAWVGYHYCYDGVVDFEVIVTQYLSHTKTFLSRALGTN